MKLVELLPLSRGNLSRILEWRNDPAIYTWCRQYEPRSTHHHEEWFTWASTDPYTKMYEVHDGPDIVGVCGLTDIDWINRRAEFSLYIGPKHQGKSYGKHALMELLKHSFDVLNLNCIWGETFDGNPALNLFNKLGFTVEGRRRQFYYRQGKYIDSFIVSILKSEFKYDLV